MVDRIERVTQRDRPSAGRQNRIAEAINGLLGSSAPTALRGSDGLHLRRALTGSSGNTILPVKNMSGASAGRFGVLGISAPLFVPASDTTGFLNEWGFEGVTPTADHAGKIAVLLDDADPGQIVPAAVDGIVVLQVDMQSDADPRADVKDGDASKLQSGADGTARILWAEAGTGTKWAMVNLAAGGAGGGGDGTFEPTFMMITTSTPTGVNDANGNPVQWEYGLMPVERGAEVVGTVAGMDWTNSTSELTKAGSAAFTDYEPQDRDMAVIADTAGVTAGEYRVLSKVDDDTIALTESITGGADVSGVELTRIKRFSGYGAWQSVQGAITRKGFNHYEANNDGVGRQGNGIDHDGANYPAGFKMQPIQNGLIVRVRQIQFSGGEEYWFAEPNAEDGTCV